MRARMVDATGVDSQAISGSSRRYRVSHPAPPGFARRSGGWQPGLSTKVDSRYGCGARWHRMGPEGLAHDTGCRQGY